MWLVNERRKYSFGFGVAQHGSGGECTLSNTIVFHVGVGAHD